MAENNLMDEENVDLSTPILSTSSQARDTTSKCSGNSIGNDVVTQRDSRSLDHTNIYPGCNMKCEENGYILSRVENEVSHPDIQVKTCEFNYCPSFGSQASDQVMSLQREYSRQQSFFSPSSCSWQSTPFGSEAVPSNPHASKRVAEVRTEAKIGTTKPDYLTPYPAATPNIISSYAATRKLDLSLDDNARPWHGRSNRSFTSSNGNGQSMKHQNKLIGSLRGPKYGDEIPSLSSQLCYSDEIPSLSVEQRYGDEIPSLSSQWCYGDEIPSLSTEQRYGGEIPSLSSQWRYGAEIPSLSTEQRYGDEIPSLSTRWRYGDETPSLSSRLHCGDEIPSLSSRLHCGDEIPSLSSRWHYGNEIPLLSRQWCDHDEIPSLSRQCHYHDKIPSLSSQQCYNDEMSSLSSQFRGAFHGDSYTRRKMASKVVTITDQLKLNKSEHAFTKYRTPGKFASSNDHYKLNKKNILWRNHEDLSDQVRGPRANKTKSTSASVEKDVMGHFICREQYNRPDLSIRYEQAKFFMIKSYSEDDVHKSIKYNVWASTPNGNNKLDAAFREAQIATKEKGAKCPIFLFFSVNASGQFVGLAEMLGPVDFKKTLDFWQQDKWNGFFPLMWHIVKDIPYRHFQHITLENNDNRIVTFSRDTQEIGLPQGLKMLEIFKAYPLGTSILDDFDFYENKENSRRALKGNSQSSSEAEFFHNFKSVENLAAGMQKISFHGKN